VKDSANNEALKSLLDALNMDDYDSKRKYM
jgi:hypothetical protein